MDSIKFTELILKNKCPYCGLKLGTFYKNEEPCPEYKNCSRCRRIWNIVNDYPCEETSNKMKIGIDLSKEKDYSTFHILGRPGIQFTEKQKQLIIGELIKWKLKK